MLAKADVVVVDRLAPRELLEDFRRGAVHGRVRRIVLLRICAHEVHVGLPIRDARVGHRVDLSANLAPCHRALNHVVIIGHVGLGNGVQKPLVFVEPV